MLAPVELLSGIAVAVLLLPDAFARVPPEFVAVNVELAPKHIVEGEALIATAGAGFTVIVEEPLVNPDDLTQPFASVTLIRLYVVVTVGSFTTSNAVADKMPVAF